MAPRIGLPLADLVTLANFLNVQLWIDDTIAPPPAWSPLIKPLHHFVVFPYKGNVHVV